MSGTFGSFHQFDLHQSVTSSFPSTDVEVDHGACLLQGLHSSTVGHVPHVQLVHSEDNVINPETHKSRLLTLSLSWWRHLPPGLRFLLRLLFFLVLDQPQQPWSTVSPQPAILGSCSSRDDFCDEDAGVFTNVRIVCASGDAESQPRVTLTTTIPHKKPINVQHLLPQRNAHSNDYSGSFRIQLRATSVSIHKRVIPFLG